jgi:hypothetical protein
MNDGTQEAIGCGRHVARELSGAAAPGEKINI